MSTIQAAAPGQALRERTSYAVLTMISFCHFLNDMIQSLLPAIYPILKGSFHLDFGQIGLITFTSQLTASVLQPVVGTFTDKRPQPFSLSIGMGFTLVGLVMLSMASSFPLILAAASLVGMGSSVFHPESSRVARMASGGRHGLAQSLFQVGGNIGSATGPLLAAFIVLPRGQGSVAWFSLAALLGIVVLANVGRWYRKSGMARPRSRAVAVGHHPELSRRRVAVALGVLIVLIFSKYFYVASLTNYYTFYLMETFGVSVQSAQIHLFVFLGAYAVGTVAGGPIGDRIGRKFVIWVSILEVLTIVIALVLSSAFAAILVYAQELMPGRVGMVAGMFFGFAFGMGGIGAALLGELADHTSIGFVYQVCAFLPALGLLTVFLPDLEGGRVRQRA